MLKAVENPPKTVEIGVEHCLFFTPLAVNIEFTKNVTFLHLLSTVETVETVEKTFNNFSLPLLFFVIP